MLKLLPWHRQPGAYTSTRRAHWSTDGLVSCWQHYGGLPIDVVRPSRRLVLNNMSVPQPLIATTQGLATNFIASVGTSCYHLADDLPVNPKNGCTILIIYRPNSSTPAATRAICGWGNTGSDTAYFQIYQSTDGGFKIQFRNDASTTVTITPTQQLLAGQTYVVAAWTDGASNHGVRINGTSYTSSTAMGALTTPTRFAINGLVRTAATNQGEGAIFGPWLYDRVLTVPQIDSLIANPWQTLEPRRSGFVYVSPTGGDISLIGSPVLVIQGTVAPGTSVAL